MKATTWYDEGENLVYESRTVYQQVYERNRPTGLTVRLAVDRLTCHSLKGMFCYRRFAYQYTNLANS